MAVHLLVHRSAYSYSLYPALILATPDPRSRLLDVILLFKQIALDLGVLELFQISFCEAHSKSAHDQRMSH